MVEALFALSGVVVGGLLTYFLTFRIEQVRWKREDNYRWSKDQRALYAQFDVSAGKAFTSATKVATMEGKDKVDPELRLRYRESLDETLSALSGIRLLGSDKVIGPAEELLVLIGEVAKQGGTEITEPQREQYRLRLYTIRRRFIDAARVELGTQ